MCESNNSSDEARKLLLSLLDDNSELDDILPKREDVEKSLRLRVSEDRMIAFLSLELGPKCKPFTEQEILRVLAEKKIYFGIRRDKIRDLVEQINKTYISVTDEIIARGKQPVLGRDANITYHFSLKPQVTSPSPDEEDKVDFKELNLINNVNEGDLLVEKTPLIEHEPGIDIYGEAVVPPPAKDAQFATGNNINISEDGLKAFAAIDGQVVIEKKLIKVLPVFFVRGDVALDTGNISFNGTVYVVGDILAGFSVTAKRDIIVSGAVEGANLTSGGDIRIRSGLVAGGKGSVRCKGDLQVKYIEKANIVCHGNLRVETSILSSQITCYSRIQMPFGVIIGGKVIGVQGIECKEIGSKIGVPTSVILGDKPVIRERISEVTAQIKEQKEVLDKILTLQKLDAEELKTLLESMDEPTREKLKSTLSRQSEIEAKIKELANKLDKLEILFKMRTEARLSVVSKVFQNVNINIGHSNLNTMEIYHHSQFYEDSFDRKIKIIPIT